MKRFAALSLLLVLVLATAGCALFTKYGSISGFVFDSISLEPIVYASVVVGGEMAQTDENGYYWIDMVKVGSHELVVYANGYQTIKDLVDVYEDEVTYVDIQLYPLHALATINGTVTDGRGGAGVPGAIVEYGGYYSTITDYAGNFELIVPPGMEADIIVTKADRGTARVQNLILNKGEVRHIEIPTRAAFSPNMSFEAPTLRTNISSDDVLSGLVHIEVSFESNDGMYVYYIYLGGEQRFPREGFDVDVEGGSYPIDTTSFPNGPTYLKILGYDRNGNVVETFIPVTIDNEVIHSSYPPALEGLDLISYTWGQNIVFYSEGMAKHFVDSFGLNIDPMDLVVDKATIDVTAAPDGATVYNRILWPTDDTGLTDGYAVYRSFDGENFRLIGNVIIGRYDDWSAELQVNQTVYYRVIPYNSYGEGEGLERMGISVPSHNVYLATPGNEDTNVELQPTFTWIPEFSQMPIATGTLYTGIQIWDSVDYLIWQDEVADINSYYMEGYALNPGGVYSWDVPYSVYLSTIEVDSFGSSTSWSVSGEYTVDGLGTGSVNGEYVFTTTTGLQ